MKKLVLATALLLTPYLAIANSDLARSEIITGFSDINSNYSQSTAINQIGSGNRAYSNQQGINNHAVIVQQGNGNQGRINQSSSNNNALIAQRGTGILRI